jgi:hypothetical protein
MDRHLGMAKGIISLFSSACELMVKKGFPAAAASE